MKQSLILALAAMVHTDLHDDVAGVIPYDGMVAFFKENLK